MKGMIFVFFLPFLLFSHSPEKTYSEKFGEAFSDFKVEECQRVLESWEQEAPQSREMITGLKATLLFWQQETLKKVLIYWKQL